MNVFNSTSMVGTGLIIVLIELVLKLFGVELPEGSVAKTVNDLVSGIGGILVIWGQLRRQDLRWGLFRK
mgnify:FL=1